MLKDKLIKKEKAKHEPYVIIRWCISLINYGLNK